MDDRLDCEVNSKKRNRDVKNDDVNVEYPEIRAQTTPSSQ